MTTPVRCDNEHYVPAGYSYCRRCDEATAAVAPVAAAPSSSSLLTLGEFAGQRDVMLMVDAGVGVTCLAIVVGMALVPALLAGVVATVGARVLGRFHVPVDESLPASAVHVKVLDRMVVAPVVAVIVTAVVSFAR